MFQCLNWLREQENYMRLSQQSRTLSWSVVRAIQNSVLFYSPETQTPTSIGEIYGIFGCRKNGCSVGQICHDQFSGAGNFYHLITEHLSNFPGCSNRVIANRTLSFLKQKKRRKKETNPNEIITLIITNKTHWNIHTNVLLRHCQSQTPSPSLSHLPQQQQPGK